MRQNLLKTFLAVARGGNITRAAMEVHLAQSSVSDQIQLLESELGSELFTRSKAGLSLTATGEAFKPYAQEILALMDEARAAVDAAAGQSARPLAIGALETIAASALPPRLAAFRDSHPHIPVRMKIDGSGALLQKLESGDIDIAFCFDKGERDPRFLSRVVSTEALVVVAAPGAHTPSPASGLHALATRNFVATQVGCVYRYLLDRAFARAAVAPPPIAAEVDSIRTIVQLVAAGVGLSLVPRLAVADALADGRLVEIPWPGPVQAASLLAVWRRRRVQPPALMEFLALAGTAVAGVTPGDARPPRAVSSPS